MDKSKFKLGDRVYVKKWLDMPQKLVDCYGINTRRIGSIGTINIVYNSGPDREGEYRISFDNDDAKEGLFVFESEIELARRQLMLFEL